ncbi:MAG: hypothetical protein HW421_2636 [Ignavibacteria bacterium]|nr:hypothetical protein [Ignavibacteria bacterium]
MFKTLILLISAFILIQTTLIAQDGITIKGKVIDSENAIPLAGATVQLLTRDSVSRYHDLSKLKGEFALETVKGGFYILKITFIGYQNYFKNIKVTDKDLNLGNISLIPVDIQGKDVEVTAKAPIGEQKNDTTELNASAFKTMPDATAEDLVKKMPGVQIEQGTVKAQGEDVKKVMVDGKPFFGDDPNATLRNLPADVVDKVQIYDKMSEQSEFTGFDDGQTQKTMNIITKNNKRNGQFGKFSGGYGNLDKYSLNANMNIFKGPQRISVLGMSNNVNQQNFSVIDILDIVGSTGPGAQLFRSFAGRGGFQGGGGRMFGGGGGGDFRGGFGGGMQNFMVGQQDGLNTTHALGTNYSDYWTDDIEVSGSYFVNYQKNSSSQIVNREIYLSQNADSNSLYNQISDNNSKNINHRFNFRFNYALDSNTSLLIKPTFSYQDNYSEKFSNDSNMYRSGFVLNKTNVSNSNQTNGFNFSNEILFRRRLGLIGRTISVSVTTGLNDKVGDGSLLNNIAISGATFTNKEINQKSDIANTGQTLGANIAYTEPVSENGQIMVSYNINRNKNNSDKQTNDFNPLDSLYNNFNDAFSNKYDNEYLYQRAGVAYRYKINELNATASLEYQKAELSGAQVFPQIMNTNYNFFNFLPSIRINYKYTKNSNLMFNYRTSTNAPSITQLQNVVDNRDPMYQSTGNPDLHPTTSHWISMRFNNFSSDFNNVFFAFLSVNLRKDNIGNSIIQAERYPIHYQSNNTTIIIPPGGQLSIPVHLQGGRNISGMVNYGFPLVFISSKMNLTLGGNYSRTPSLISNGIEKRTNYSDAYYSNIMALISSNISQDMDFTISTRYNFNKTVNSTQSNQDLNYGIFQNNANFKWIFWEGFFFQFDINNQLYTGLAPSSNNFTLFNISFGSKLFENQTGEVKLSIFDVLNQNKSVQTNFSDLYSETVYNNKLLTRYVMLTFTYNLRKFNMTGIGGF